MYVAPSLAALAQLFARSVSHCKDMQKRIGYTHNLRSWSFWTIVPYYSLAYALMRPKSYKRTWIITHLLVMMNARIGQGTMSKDAFSITSLGSSIVMHIMAETSDILTAGLPARISIWLIAIAAIVGLGLFYFADTLDHTLFIVATAMIAPILDVAQLVTTCMHPFQLKPNELVMFSTHSLAATISEFIMVMNLIGIYDQGDNYTCGAISGLIFNIADLFVMINIGMSWKEIGVLVCIETALAVPTIVPQLLLWSGASGETVFGTSCMLGRFSMNYDVRRYWTNVWAREVEKRTDRPVCPFASLTPATDANLRAYVDRVATGEVVRDPRRFGRFFTSTPLLVNKLTASEHACLRLPMVSAFERRPSRAQGDRFGAHAYTRASMRATLRRAFGTRTFEYERSVTRSGRSKRRSRAVRRSDAFHPDPTRSWWSRRSRVSSQLERSKVTISRTGPCPRSISGTIEPVQRKIL